MIAYRLMVLGRRAWGGKDASPPPPHLFLFPFPFQIPPNKNALHFCKAYLRQLNDAMAYLLTC